MTTNPDPKALASRITSSVETYLTRFSTLNKTPDFTAPFPETIHDETVQQAKLDILRNCERLMALVQGPVQWLMFQNMAFVDPVCIGLAIELGILEIVTPGTEPTDLETIVQATGAGKEVVRMFYLFSGSLGCWTDTHGVLIGRIMRVCTQRLFFEEVAPDQWIHTTVSFHVLAPPVQALISHWFVPCRLLYTYHSRI